ncbi:hypothetical protein [Phyllobacterium sp.]|uniref:hypothetical protein n=1 Tax=Phyllobacterium sp. TaxID=1871046 RepID=UPI0030F42910
MRSFTSAGAAALRKAGTAALFQVCSSKAFKAVAPTLRRTSRDTCENAENGWKIGPRRFATAHSNSSGSG